VQPWPKNSLTRVGHSSASLQPSAGRFCYRRTGSCFEPYLHLLGDARLRSKWAGHRWSTRGTLRLSRKAQRSLISGANAKAAASASGRQMPAPLTVHKLTLKAHAALPRTPPLICMSIASAVESTARFRLKKGSAKTAQVGIVLTLVSLTLSSNGSSDSLI